MVAPMTMARAKREQKLSKRFKRWMDGDDEFAGRWDFNKVLRALQRLERIDRAAIAAVREREGPAEAMRAELDVLSASHKDLAHRLARMGEELEKARGTIKHAALRMHEAESKVSSSKASATRARTDCTIARNERDSARALLRKCYPFILRASEASEDDDILDLPARIAKELGPTETKRRAA